VPRQGIAVAEHRGGGERQQQQERDDPRASDSATGGTSPTSIRAATALPAQKSGGSVSSAAVPGSSLMG